MTLTATETILAPPPSRPVEHHRADIDGLRAVAVLIVLLYHAGLGFPGGFIGVDVFFVISGYLITGIILREMEAGTFTLRGFWLRRIRRIAPAAAVVSTAVLLAGQGMLLPRPLTGLAESAVAHQLLMANVYFWQQGGYFDGPAELKPLLHTWSLAVEEQFYLVFPLVCVAAWRLGRKGLFRVLALTAIASLASSLYLAERSPSANFYWLPPRAWELLVGALLAFTSPGAVPARLRPILGSLGLAGILICACLYSSSLEFPGLTALPPTLAAVAVLQAGRIQPPLAGRLLAVRPLRMIGSASYSVYLWHWPLLAFLRHGLGRSLPLGVRLGVVVASLILGFISWQLVEEPIRRRRIFRSGRSALALYAFVTCGLACTAAYIAANDGLPGRLSIRAAALAETRLAKVRTRKLSSDVPSDVFALGAIREGATPKAQPDFLVWGDSHARAAAGLIGRLAEERGLEGLLAWRPGHAPLIGACRANQPESDKQEQLRWNQDIAEMVARKRIRHVFLVTNWVGKLLARPGSLLISDAWTRHASEADASRAFNRALVRTVSMLEASGARVYVLRQPPVQDVDLVRAAQAGRFDPGELPRGISRPEHQRQQLPFDAGLDACGARRPVILGPSASWYDDRGYSRITNGSRVYYTDADHVSSDGAEVYFRPLLEPVFHEIARGER